MSDKTKRITTGVTEQGQSAVLAEEKVGWFAPYPLFECFQLQNLFYTEDNLQTLKTRHLDSTYDINLPPGAMRFMKVRMPTKKEMVAGLEQAGQPLPDDWSKFNLHNTDSVDYLYVLSGKVTCVAGETQTELKAGDFLAQVGPEHTWINDGDEPCHMLCIMVGIEPTGLRKKMEAVE